MRRSLALLPLVLGLAAAPAQAESVTVPGCFGAVVLVCQPTVTVQSPAVVGTYELTVPVCAGSCYDVPVTMVSAGVSGTASVCVSYESREGVPWQYCVTRAVPPIPTVPDYAAIVTEFVEDFIDGRTVNEIAEDVAEDAVDAMWTPLCRLAALRDNPQCW